MLNGIDPFFISLSVNVYLNLLSVKTSYTHHVTQGSGKIIKMLPNIPVPLVKRAGWEMLVSSLLLALIIL